MSGYDVVVCEQCGFGFADDIPPQSTFDAYYQDLSKYVEATPVGNTPTPLEQRFRDQAETIDRFIPGAMRAFLRSAAPRAGC